MRFGCRNIIYIGGCRGCLFLDIYLTLLLGYMVGFHEAFAHGGLEFHGSLKVYQ